MATFDKREQAFEQKFVRDEELKFRAIARRNRKLGHWAAHEMGPEEAAADAYALSMVDLDLTAGLRGGLREDPRRSRAELHSSI